MVKDDYNYYAAAYLASKGRIKSQKEISRILKISEPTVSRLIKRALKENLLETRYPKIDLEQSELDEISASLEALNTSEKLERELKTLSRGRLKNVRVFGGANSKKNLQPLFDGAARFVIEKICRPDTRYIGILWGATICKLIDAMERQYAGKELTKTINKEFMPLCGDSVNATQHGSELIARLYKIFRGETSDKYVFAVNASIPGKFNKNEIKVIRKYIMEVGGFANVFKLEGDQLRVRKSLSLVITSCSGSSPAHNTWLRDSASIEGISAPELEEITIGNIGGYWLPRENVSTAGKRRLGSINARWNGIIGKDFEEMAKEDAVVLIGGEERKAEIILKLVERQMVNHLLISHETAKKLKQRLGMLDEPDDS